jgi:hypothetical protein
MPDPINLSSRSIPWCVNPEDEAASLGASVSSGEGRDLDGDGKAERCFSVSFGPVTLGECDEL